MQTLDVISVNIWDILVSLINLVLLFLIIKKFLYKPVKKVLEKRQKELDEQYLSAETAEIAAKESKQKWEEALSGAKSQANEIIEEAALTAKRRGDKIVDDAKAQADGIIHKAEQDAYLERKKAEQEIKREIVEVSGALSEKLIGREINVEDHRAFIDSFIEEIGESDE